MIVINNMTEICKYLNKILKKYKIKEWHCFTNNHKVGN